MRLLAILITLLIIGFLLQQQLGGDTDNTGSAGSAQSLSDSKPPKVPSKPEDLEQFNLQMDSYLQQEAAKRAAEIEQAEAD